VGGRGGGAAAGRGAGGGGGARHTTGTGAHSVLRPPSPGSGAATPPRHVPPLLRRGSHALSRAPSSYQEGRELHVPCALCTQCFGSWQFAALSPPVFRAVSGV
jgi:hypothetical protein